MLKLKEELYLLSRQVRGMKHNAKSVQSKRIYEQWLQSIQTLIDICVERNRF